MMVDREQLYRRHVEHGESIRSLARGAGVHASTVMRWIRRIEARRDDPLIDAALSCPGGLTVTDDQARPVLRRLAERGAVMVVADTMEKAIIVRDGIRTMIFNKSLAEGLALAGWIVCEDEGQMRKYSISRSGRDHLRSALRTSQRRGRINIKESPLTVLARRRDRRGLPFLTPDMVKAAERLRSDFEADYRAEHVDRALDYLGAEMAELVIGVCCHLEGIETVETRLGWSARSGKIVLRLALMRLHQHYMEADGSAVAERREKPRKAA